MMDKAKGKKYSLLKFQLCTSKMKNSEKYLGQAVSKAVITVPLILICSKTSNKRCWKNCRT